MRRQSGRVGIPGGARCPKEVYKGKEGKENAEVVRVEERWCKETHAIEGKEGCINRRKRGETDLER